MTEQEQIIEYAEKLMRLAQDTIIVRFRFFDIALAKLKHEAVVGLGGYVTDEKTLFYDPATLLKDYLSEPNIAVRLYLHVMLHCVFMHRGRFDKTDENYWNLAADIAVENIILELDMASSGLSTDEEASNTLRLLSKNVDKLTAEKLYREFMVHGLSSDLESKLKRLFTIDNHEGWRTKSTKEEIIISEEEWRKIARRIKTDIGTFSKGKTESESLAAGVEEATKDRYDYRKLLERFVVNGEEMTVNDDEFDYIYYTYGLTTYGNMPLVEPLEYKEVNKVREFVIAIDTSGSCSGDIVKSFIQKTYEILKGTENFFHRVNVHIIQCDNEIRSVAKITCEEDFKEYMENARIVGYGSTDFRPVFQYVDELCARGEFENLKGLIYFTDGYGVYPERMPDYDVIFAFLNEDEYRAKVPAWAIKVVMEDELSEY
ncbi:MAG: VWA-like domain-containing protein [Wujia sp.]